MDEATIVPNYQIANPPFLRPMIRARVDVFPQRIEQSFAFFGRHTWYIGIWSATEEESWLTRCRVSYYKRMNSAWPLFMAIGFVKPMTQLTRGVARRIVLATGSRAKIPNIKGLDKVNYLTNESLFDLRKSPRHLAIIGGGPIGQEMAQAHARQGVKTTIIEINRNKQGNERRFDEPFYKR